VSAVAEAGRRRSGAPDAATVPGDRRGRARLVLWVLAFLLAATGLVSLWIGATDTGHGAVFRTLTNAITGEAPGDPASVRERVIVIDIRMPRVILGILVGAALAVSGAVMQGLFRNPLADPGLVSVSGGAALAVVCTIVLAAGALAPLYVLLGLYAIPVAAFCGGLISTLLLYGIATRRGRTSVATMLLAGIALAALAGAGTGFLVFRSTDQQLRDITFWGLGSLGGATWTKIAMAGPLIAAALAATPFISRGLNALVLGEAEAFHLGLPVQALKRTAVLVVAAATGAAVAVSGAIGFVGIVVPHLLRLVIGPDNRYLIPASALLGAVLLLVADAIARVVVAPAELPIGIVTAAIGAPFFLWILLRQRGVLDL
jgi:iron complex transport system permease protein